MAEEENKPALSMFIIREKGSKEKKFDNLKKRYPLDKILAVLGCGDENELEDLSEGEIAARIEAKISAELAAMNTLIKENDDRTAAQKKQDYEDKFNERIKDENEKLKTPLLGDDYFNALGEWDEKKERYQEYDAKKAELIKEEEEAEKKDRTDKEKQLDKIKFQQKREFLEKEYADEIAAERKWSEERNNAFSIKDELGDLQRIETDASLMLFNKSLRSTRKEVQEEGNELLTKEFDKVYKGYVNDGYFAPQGKGVNEHNFSVKEVNRKKVISHTIKNLDGTGLNLAMLGSEISIAQCPNPMTEKQLKALAQYCYHHNIAIEDFKNLANIQVKDELDNDLGKVPAQFAEKTKELEENNGFYTKTKYQESNDEKDYAKANDSLQDEASIPLFAAYDENAPSPKEAIGDRSKMTKAALNRLSTIGFGNPEQIVVSHGFNSTIISVYSNENDKLSDGQTDRDGAVKRTKAFAVKFVSSNPPEAYFYLGTAKEFSDKHARLILDGFKACGSEYFILPGGNEIGGSNFDAFMKASGKSLMVPVCKRSKNDEGTILANDNVTSILETIKKENKHDATAVIKFKQKLLRELEAQEAYLKAEAEAKAKKEGKKSEYRTNTTLNTTMQMIEGGIRFGKFQSSYLDQLQEFVDTGIQKGYGNPPKKWDEIDRAAACSAMAEIGKQLSKGSLNGVKFDPLDTDGKNFELLKMELARNMAKKKPKIVENILHLHGKDKSYDEDEETGERYRADKQQINKYIRSVEGEMSSEYKRICGEFVIEKMEPRFAPAAGYDIDEYSKGKIPPTNFGDEKLDNAYSNSGSSNTTVTMTNTPKSDREMSAYLKASQEAKRTGQKPLRYDEWKKMEAMKSR